MRRRRVALWCRQRGGVGDSGGETAGSPKPQEKKQAPRPALKNDPRLVAAARELRDRWLEHAAARPGLIEAGANAKYAIGRAMDGAGMLLPGAGALPGKLPGEIPGDGVKRLDAA